jgi:Glycosyl hydrolase family 115/Gylcosyl hydrolase family 115 C-terminal domain
MLPVSKFFGCMSLLLLLASQVARANIGDESFITFTRMTRSVALVAEGTAAPLWLDGDDHAEVLRAARDLRSDIEKVSGAQPAFHTDVATPNGKVVVLAGTLGRSRLIDDLVKRRRVDVRAIDGKWEAFVIEVLDHPLPGVDSAVIIIGSDARGTIYGLYEISQQIGVSPWHWWADVPVAKQNALYVKRGRVVNTGPAVRYRGIFLNDEAPALQRWAEEKFGGLNHEFYAHVFELILRLRGNYLWPAMWSNAFADDDPQNAPLAKEYGIVLGTSHHEPLMRAHDEWRRYGTGPWDYSRNSATLQKFWRGGVERVRDNEKIISIGMRGDGDEAMSEETNVALLERIIADQRVILKEVLGREPAQIPQLWALYKEVQDYYERGMRVPDDVTLLWCDDNWGNIRRLPTPEERHRAGGAGVYYHFDYVGGPRNYKWLNTVPITKVWEQMNLAAAYGADRVWIVNVGDLKPMEFPIEFFLTFAWDPRRWSQDTLNDYAVRWGQREFGERHGAEVAALINGYTRLNARRKPEMLAPETLSLVNYREAERVSREWQDLVARAERLNAELPQEQRAAFFQLVLYPVKASAGIQELYIAAGRNRLYAAQGRVSANAEAEKVRALFAADAALAREYHQIKGGKWNHMMSQVKLGYVTWQQPEAEVMPAVSEVRPRAGASMAIAIEGSATAWPSYRAGAAVLPPLGYFARGTRRIEVFNRGDQAFRFRASADQPWLHVIPSSGEVTDTLYIEVSVDWEAAPSGDSTALLSLETEGGKPLTVRVPVTKPVQVPPRSFKGFIESDRHVAIEAPHFSRAVNDREVTWRTLPDFGRTLGGVTAFPVTAHARKLNARSARLEYDTYLYSTGDVNVELHLAPTWDFQSGEGLQFAVSFDDAPPQVLKLATGAKENWSRAVSEGVRRVSSKHRIERSGEHVLKFWMITPGVVLERIVIDAGGVRESYLGPPESPRAP